MVNKATLLLIMLLALVGCYHTQSYHLEPIEALRQKHPDIANNFISLHRTSVGYIEQITEDNNRFLASMIKGIRKVKNDPEAIEKTLSHYERILAHSPNKDSEWLSLKNRIRSTDAMFYFFYEIPEAKRLGKLEEGTLVIRNGEIVYINLFQDIIDAGLENRDNL